MKRELTEFDPNYEHDREAFMKNVKQKLNLGVFNRIKQFMLRLYKNNLFGEKSK